MAVNVAMGVSPSSATARIRCTVTQEASFEYKDLSFDLIAARIPGGADSIVRAWYGRPAWRPSQMQLGIEVTEKVKEKLKNNEALNGDSLGLKRSWLKRELAIWFEVNVDAVVREGEVLHLKRFEESLPDAKVSFTLSSTLQTSSAIVASASVSEDNAVSYSLDSESQKKEDERAEASFFSCFRRSSSTSSTQRIDPDPVLPPPQPNNPALDVRLQELQEQLVQVQKQLDASKATEAKALKEKEAAQEAEREVRGKVQDLIDKLREKPENFNVGDTVQLTFAYSDVASGSLGKVVKRTDDDRVVVEFPRGTWSYLPSLLVRKASLERLWSEGMRISIDNDSGAWSKISVPSIIELTTSSATPMFAELKDDGKLHWSNGKVSENKSTDKVSSRVEVGNVNAESVETNLTQLLEVARSLAMRMESMEQV